MATVGPWAQNGSKLVGSPTTGAGAQGYAVSIYGDTMAVGAYNGSGSGSTFIYVRGTNGSWSQQAQLIGTGTAGTSCCQGFSVSLYEDTLAVGGPSDNSNAGAAWVFIRNGTTWTQQGSKLVGSAATGAAQQGMSVSLYKNTLIVGGPSDNSNVGAVWVYIRDTTGAWSQQGSKLVPTGYTGSPLMGYSCSLYEDTLAAGGYGDNTNIGAAWIFTRNTAGTWSQQGSKLVGTGASGTSFQGASISLYKSTLAVGGFGDASSVGAAWIYVLNNGTWTQQGSKLVGTSYTSTPQQGFSLSLYENTLVSGGFFDNSGQGAVWIFTRNGPSGTKWTQQCPKLLGYDASSSYFGRSVAMYKNTIVIGGSNDTSGLGAAWIYDNFTTGLVKYNLAGAVQGLVPLQNFVPKNTLCDANNNIYCAGNLTNLLSSQNVSTPVQVGSKLVGSGGSGSEEQGWSVSISGDGLTAIVGGPNDNGQNGAAWIFKNVSGIWTQQAKLIGSGGSGTMLQGQSVSINTDGTVVAIGGPNNNSQAGGTWIFQYTGGSWSQVGVGPLVGTGVIATNAQQGASVALSSDGQTVAIGGPFDNGNVGAIWIFKNISGTWTQQAKVVPSDAVGGNTQFGNASSISSNGTVVAVGGASDSGTTGATWVVALTNGSWSQIGTKLVGSGASGGANQGFSVSISSDGLTMVTGGPQDAVGNGAVWFFKNNAGTWSQVGSKIIPGVTVQFGTSVAMSGDGLTTSIGAPAIFGNGGLYIYKNSAGTWSRFGGQVIGSGASGSEQGYSTSISSNGTVIVSGGPFDNSNQGATWIFAINRPPMPIYNFYNNYSQQYSISQSTRGVLILKWSSTGAAVGYTYIQGASNNGSVGSYGPQLTTDSVGNLYCAGVYNSNTTVPIYDFGTTLNSTSFSLPATVVPTTFIIKWSPQGIAKSWTVNGPATGTTSAANSTAVGIDLVTDIGDNIYFSNTYNADSSVSLMDFTSTSTTTNSLSLTLPASTITSNLVPYNTTTASMGTWITTASMNYAKYGFAACTLNDGRVLVAGGRTNGTVTNGSEYFTPSVNTWTTTGNMNTAREAFKLVSMKNQTALAIGGVLSGGLQTATCEIYNPQLGTWSTTGSLNTPRGNFQAISLDNNNVLVSGGETGSTVLATCEIYNPGTGLWITTGSMAVARKNHIIQKLPNGSIIVAGGITVFGATTSTVISEIYSPTTGTWATSGFMAGTAGTFCAPSSVMQDGNILMFGGGDTGVGFSTSGSFVYKSATALWNASTAYPITGTNTSFSYGNLIALSNGQQLLIGGSTDNTLATNCYLYNPVTASWSTTGAMNFAHIDYQATVNSNVQLLTSGYPMVFGGRTTLTATIGTNRSEIYVPNSANTSIVKWSPSGSLVSYTTVPGTWNYSVVPYKNGIFVDSTGFLNVASTSASNNYLYNMNTTSTANSISMALTASIDPLQTVLPSSVMWTRWSQRDGSLAPPQSQVFLMNLNNPQGPLMHRVVPEVPGYKYYASTSRTSFVPSNKLFFNNNTWQ
jgi:hypothetical protein